VIEALQDPGIPGPRVVADAITAAQEQVTVRTRQSRIEPVDARTYTALLEQHQEGYVATVAATAACIVESVKRDVYGFDCWLVRPPVSIGAGEETMIAVQLKNITTVRPDPAKGWFSYQFKDRRSFEVLARPRRMKAILLVMVTPPQQARWTSSDHDFLRVEHCCYWANLEGHEAAPGVQYPTVRVPTANIFDASSLTAMMDRLERGEAL